MPERLARVVALASAFGAVPGAAAACIPSPVVLVSGDVSEPVALSVTGACPYDRLTLDYGPLSVVEEASVHGDLDVMLPRMPDAADLRVAWADGAVSLPVPEAAADHGFAAIVEGAAARLSAPAAAATGQVGFPVAGAPPLSFVMLPPGAAASVVFDLTAETCGTDASATVYAGGAAGAQTVTVAMPSCDGPAAAIRVPLAR